jgi:GT2 family glycosyltransferase
LDVAAQKVLAKEIPEIEYCPGMDFQLHGACMFFANRFVEKYDGLCDKTFMYGEENILKYMVTRDQMHMAYLEDVTVYHKEGAKKKDALDDPNIMAMIEMKVMSIPPTCPLMAMFINIPKM